MALGNADLIIASYATVDARVWCCFARFVDRVVSGVVGLVNVLAVLVLRHENSPEKKPASGEDRPRQTRALRSSRVAN